jgi:hypothetical protein
MDGATQIGPQHATQTKLANGLNKSRVSSAFAVPRRFDPKSWLKPIFMHMGGSKTHA